MDKRSRFVEIKWIYQKLYFLIVFIEEERNRKELKVIEEET
jgi:hypothetical protein